MKSYPTKFKSFLCKIVQMGTLQKLQNSIQTLIIFWPVYPIHTNSLFWVIFVELPFCHFPPPNTSIRGKDSNFFKQTENNHTLSQSSHVSVMAYSTSTAGFEVDPNVELYMCSTSEPDLSAFPFNFGYFP